MPKIDGSESHAIDQIVGRRIKVRRSLLRMSQTGVAERLGITFQQLQKYEKGSNRLSASRLYQLSHILGVPMTYFFEGLDGNAAIVDGSAEPDFEVVGKSFWRQSTRLMRAFSGVQSTKTRTCIAKLVEQLAGIDAEE